MEVDNNQHEKFITTYFSKVELEEKYHVLPLETDEIDKTSKKCKILQWYEFRDSNLYIPIIDSEGQTVYYNKCYCEYCKSWFVTKFRLYYIEQHMNGEKHQYYISLREYQRTKEVLDDSI